MVILKRVQALEKRDLMALKKCKTNIGIWGCMSPETGCLNEPEISRRRIGIIRGIMEGQTKLDNI